MPLKSRRVIDLSPALRNADGCRHMTTTPNARPSRVPPAHRLHRPARGRRPKRHREIHTSSPLYPDFAEWSTRGWNRPFSLAPRWAGSAWSQHAATWPHEMAKLGGTARLPIAIAEGHRWRNLQPLGGASRLGGAPLA